jgi:hypothetical protein
MFDSVVKFVARARCASSKRTFCAKSLSAMLMRITKIILAIALSFTFTFSLWKIIICVHEKYFNEADAVNTWLEVNSLGSYKDLFRESGKSQVCVIQDIPMDGNAYP